MAHRRALPSTHVRIAALAGALAVTCIQTPTTATAATREAATVQSTVTTGLTTPWGMAFLPDGSALVSERDTGVVKRVAKGGRTWRVGRVQGVQFGGEGGLLGLAVHPGFPRQPLVYAYVTTPADNRIVRMRWARGRLGSARVVLKGIPRAGNHNGGRLAFGPDGMLYAGTGDAGDTSLSQRRSSLGGKILRMTPTGAVPSGNPFRGSYVWSLGHRNVQGLGWDGRGRMWASEFGQSTWDELNRIVKGRNYGWPLVEGKVARRGFTQPYVAWDPADASPSGIAVVGSTAYVAGLRGQRLWQVPLTGGSPRALLTERYGRLRAAAEAPDGSLWVMTGNTDGRIPPRRGDDRLLRLSLG